MVKIAFRLEEINVRGTTVALYDYARYNEEILGNHSIIIMDKKSLSNSDPPAVVRIVSRFTLFLYNDLDEMEDILQKEGVDILYCIKYGKDDGVVSHKVKSVIHCVFDMSEPHGDVYAGVSEAVAKKFGHNLFVPHMIGLQPDKRQNRRKELGIPSSAVVFGRYGGMDTFNLEFCWHAIANILSRRSDIYFLFINTPRMIKHPRVMYLSKVVNEEDKNAFISTCDAYLECGNLGHSFGLAIGEFSVHNKPIIAYRGPELWNRAHLDILGNRGIYFSNYDQFYSILNSFDPSQYKDRDMNCYRQYEPEKVMKIFHRVFIEEENKNYNK